MTVTVDPLLMCLMTIFGTIIVLAILAKRDREGVVESRLVFGVCAFGIVVAVIVSAWAAKTFGM